MERGRRSAERVRSEIAGIFGEHEVCADALRAAVGEP